MTRPRRSAGGRDPRARASEWQAASVRALQYQRFTRLNRALHVLMIVSFISLALTGHDAQVLLHRAGPAFLSRLLGGFESGRLHPPRSRPP